MTDKEYSDKRNAYKDKLKEFFKERLRFTYYEIVQKTDGKLKQPSIFRMIDNSSNYLDSVKNCILNYKTGLMDLARHGKEVIDLSFEAILYYNKDYQALYNKDDLEKILEVCEFALNRAYKEADRLEAERLQAKNKS